MTESSKPSSRSKAPSLSAEAMASKRYLEAQDRRIKRDLKHLQPIPVRGPDAALIAAYNGYALAYAAYITDALSNPEADVTVSDSLGSRMLRIPAQTVEGMLLKINVAASLCGETATEFPWGGKDFRWDTKKYTNTAQVEFQIMSILRDDLRRRMASPSDPIEAMLQKLTVLRAEWEKISDELDKAEATASNKFGRRPFALIAWRNYSAIGGTEIDDRRQEFLDAGIDPAIVEREYRDAKKRERAAERAVTEWDKRAGVGGLRKQMHDALIAVCRCERSLGRTKPSTVAGAAALLRFVVDENLFDTWHVKAIKNATAALSRLSEGQ